MNVLIQRMDQFAQTHHQTLLQALRDELRRTNPFAYRRGTDRLTLHVDPLANALLGLDWKAHQVLSEATDTKARVSTIFLPSEETDAVRKLLCEIADQLKAHLETLGLARNVPFEQIVGSVRGDIRKVSPFERWAKDAPRELSKPFSTKRKRLRFKRPPVDEESGTFRQGPPLMRFHKLQISIETREDALLELASTVRTKFAQDLRLEPTDLSLLDEHLAEQVSAPGSELARLVRLIATETIGQLKKEAALQYLSFLGEQMGIHHPAFQSLRILQGRLRALQRFLCDEDKGDSDYEVVYQGQPMDIRALFAPAAAFDDLPVFPLIDGLLGKTSERGGKDSYIFGMKLKLNGKVTRFANLSSFDYHLALLRKQYKTHPERLVRLSLLYFVVFSHFNDASYDPIAALENEILPILQGDTTQASGQQAVDDLFVRIAESCRQVAGLVKQLADRLRKVVRQVSGALSYKRDVRIGVRGGILQHDVSTILDEGRLLREYLLARDRKDYLAYMEVTEPAAMSQALFTLDASITFEDVHCFEEEGEFETCSIAYDTGGKVLLPVLFSVPNKPIPSSDLLPTIAHKPAPGLSIPCPAFLQSKQGMVRVHHASPTHWFLYRYIVSLLAYLSIELLASSSDDPLFLSIVRMHQSDNDDGANDEEDPERFLASLSKVLAHLLGVDYLANAQGLKVSSARDAFKQRNASTSLYSVLPKVFSFPSPMPAVSFDRLALITISSRESESLHKSSKFPHGRYSTVMGEVVEIAYPDSTSARVFRHNTFCETYSSDLMYKAPDVIFDQIHRLYERGIRHIFYVAAAPYSSTLRISRVGSEDTESEGLFFLSREVIKECVKGKPDLVIYPIFRDQYHAVKLAHLSAATLYTQDLAELLRVVEDKSQQMVVFLNLFSGLPNVGSNDGVEKYHGVVSYATLLGVFEDILSSRTIYEALLQDNGGENALKNRLILSLTLFHLARYEARKKEIAIKLNPYEALLGEKSVGVAATGRHALRSVRFNFLSFLSFVRKAIKPTEGRGGQR